MRKRSILWLLVVAGGLGAALAGGLVLHASRPRLAAAEICADPNAFQIELGRPFHHKGGLMYEALVRSDSGTTPKFLKHPLLGNMRLGPSDTENAPQRSTAILCEDERRLGPPHSTNTEIYNLGKGRYSHNSNFGILFSTSDGSNPNSNGRRYRALEP